jgi:hypothetical protein
LIKAATRNEQIFDLWSSAAGQNLPVATGRFMAMNMAE